MIPLGSARTRPSSKPWMAPNSRHSPHRPWRSRLTFIPSLSARHTRGGAGPPAHPDRDPASSLRSRPPQSLGQLPEEPFEIDSVHPARLREAHLPGESPPESGIVQSGESVTQEHGKQPRVGGK